MKCRSMIALTIVLLASGCAANRGLMTLSVPPATATASHGIPVYIDRIADNRVFEDKPAQPSTPSLKGGKATSEGEAIKARAIARKRNGYGMALGDILLEGDQSVIGVMRDLLQESFKGAGYRIVDERSQLGEEGLEVDASIEKFWAWFTPGFFAVAMESQIETALQVTQGEEQREVHVRAHGRNSGQSGREGNWIEAYRRGFEDYRVKLAEAFPR